MKKKKLLACDMAKKNPDKVKVKLSSVPLNAFVDVTEFTPKS